MSRTKNTAQKENANFLELQRLVEAKPNLDESCILNQSLTLMANKWTLLILVALVQGTKRNTELLRQINGISPKMLAQTLKTLMDYGMVERKVYPEVPPRVEYFLTPFGKSTADPLVALLKWSVEWEPQLTQLYQKNLVQS